MPGAMLWAAFTSALQAYPQAVQAKTAWLPVAGSQAMALTP